MILQAHGDRKYQSTTSHLVDAVGLSNLRVEHRFIEAGFQKPGVCVANEIACVLSGRAFAIQEANGQTHRNFIQPDIACICPGGNLRGRQRHHITDRVSPHFPAANLDPTKRP
jgi:hypothetical protein